MAGEYTTAEDAGIETADVRTFAETTRYIRNLPLDDAGDGALCIAWGVLHGIRAGLNFAGCREIRGSRIAVEGLGKVGMALCELLDWEGADLTVYDIDREKMEVASKRFGANVAGAGEIHSVPPTFTRLAHWAAYSARPRSRTLRPV